MRNTLTRTIAGILVVVLLAAFLAVLTRNPPQTEAAPSSQATNDTSVAFNPQHILLAQGETAIMPIYADLGAQKLGAATLTIRYWDHIVDATMCGAIDGMICNHPHTSSPTQPGEVKFSGAWAAGLTGTVKLGEIIFIAVGSPGNTTALDITASVWVDTNGNPLPAADGIPDRDGSINVRQPLPTPTPVPPTPTATVAPTETPIPPTATPVPNYAPVIETFDQDGASLVIGTQVTLIMTARDQNGGIDIYKADLWFNDGEVMTGWYTSVDGVGIVSGNEKDFQWTIIPNRCPAAGCGVPIEVLAIVADKAFASDARVVGAISVTP